MPATADDPRLGFARTLSGLSVAFAGLAVPVGMFIFSRSSPLMLAIAALLALAGVWQAGRFGELAGAAARAVRSPWGVALCAALAYFALSLAWTHFRIAGLIAFGELLAGVAGASLLAGCWQVMPPRHPGRWLAAGLALGAALTIADLATNLAFRSWLGIRNRTFVLNRTVVSQLLLVWPCIALAIWPAALLSTPAAVLVGSAIASSESGAALLGAVVGLAAYVAGRFAPRLVLGTITAGAIAVLAISPMVGPILDRALPASLHHAMQDMHSKDRVDIWRSFGAAVAERPVFGSGFNASARMADDPVAKQVAEPNRVLLGAGHPHNALLQVWVEGGAVGAGLVALLFLAVARSAMRLSGPAGAAASALAASGFAIAAVSHGAWQGWWIAGVGLSIVFVAQAQATESNHG